MAAHEIHGSGRKKRQDKKDRFDGIAVTKEKKQ